MYSKAQSRLLWLGAFVMVCSIPATAGTVLLTFNDVPQEAFLTTTSLAAYGIDSVTSQAGSYPAVVHSCGQGCANVLPAGTSSFLSTAGGTYPTPVGTFATTFLFHDPTPYFSFFKSGYSVPTTGVAGWSASAYDADDQLVASVGVNLAGGLDYPPSPTPVSYSLSGNAAIVKVVFLSNYNYQSTTGSVQVTNFQYEVADAAVPEPATAGVAVMGLAVILTAAAARRRRQ